MSSLDLEDLISCHPAVAEVAVIAVSDEKWGERPHALIVLRADQRATLTADSIRALVVEAARDGRLPNHAVDELARTSVGKVNKRRLRELYS